MSNKLILKRVFPVILAVIILFSFILLALSFVFSIGICCGDDAYHAIIAKNLACGRGYTSTIQDGVANFIPLQFDPRVGVGPTIIIPASLMIKFFGNTYWAPGLSNVVLWSLLFIAIGLLVRKYYTGIGLSLATLSFFYLSYTLMTFHYEQWFALLGEIPAALLIILSVLIFFYKDKKLNQIFAGIAMSFAVQAKLLALFSFIAFLIILFLFYISDQSKKISNRLEEFIFRIIYLLIGFLIPLLTFETWKFFKLGASEYIINWNDYLTFIIDKGANQSHTQSLLTLYKTRVTTIYDRFGITFQSIAFLLGIVGVLVNKDKFLRRIFIIFTTMILFYSLWWIFFSIGWARYYIIPLILIIAIASLPFLILYHSKWIWLYLLLIFIFPAYSWDHISYPISMIDSGYFKPAKRTVSLLKTSNILSDVCRQNTVITQWWATAANLEYISNSYLIFTTYLDEKLKNTTSYCIAVDTYFIDSNDEKFNELINKCKLLSKLDNYMVVKCE